MRRAKQSRRGLAGPLSGTSRIQPQPERWGTPRRLLVTAILLLAAGAGGWLGAVGFEPLAQRYLPGALTVSSVSIQGARRVPLEELAALAGVEAGADLRALSAPAIEERIESHPWVADARVALLRPGRVLVAVREREPGATLVLEDGSHWLVDDSGTPFLSLPRRAAGLPVLTGPSTVELGMRSGLLAEGIAMARLVAARGVGAVKSIRVDGPHPGSVPSLRLRDRPQTIIVGAGDTEAKLGRLAALLDSDLAEVRQASEIDLRFGDRMVIRGGPSPTGGEAASARGHATAPSQRPLG